MKLFLQFFMLLFITLPLSAQNVGIGTNSPSEKLDVNGNARANGNVAAKTVSVNSFGLATATPGVIMDLQSTSQGVLVPRMTLAQRNAISNPANGLLIFQTDFTQNPGFYYYSAAWGKWVKVGCENPLVFVSYITPGSFTLTVPEGVNTMEFEAVSGGGGGGGGQLYNASFCGVGGGGGGGAYANGILYVNPGDVLTLIVGTPGAGGNTNTTPVHGTNGTDAGNTTILVNGITVLDITGGKGGAGGYSDGTNNTGLGIYGGDGGHFASYAAAFITLYNYGNGSLASIGASWNAGTASQWGIGSAIIGLPQYTQLNNLMQPINGQGGRGGTNSFAAFNGQPGYIKLKYR